jgi:hypothetical protein
VSNAFKLIVVCLFCLTARAAAHDDSPRPTVLHKNDGDLRTRRPRDGVSSPSTIPAGTWISLKNLGNETVSLVSIWNEPSFEAMLRCGSVPKGQPAEPLSREGVQDCYHHGDADLEK